MKLHQPLSRRFCRLGLSTGLFGLLLCNTMGYGQPGTPTPTPKPDTTSTGEKPGDPGAKDKGKDIEPKKDEKPEVPKVPSVTRVRSDGEGNALQLGRQFEVTVKHLPELLKKQGISDIVLYLDNYPLPAMALGRKSTAEVKPIPSPTPAQPGEAAAATPPPAEDGNILIFKIELSKKKEDREIQQKSLDSLLGRPELGFSPPPRMVRVSVGLKDGPIETSEKPHPFIILSRNWYWLHIILLSLVIGGFFLLAVGSNLLRDPGADSVKQLPVSGWFKFGAMLHNTIAYLKAADGERRPYSLARTQLAIWFLVIFAAFVFIWMVTGRLDSLTTQALALLGISSGTALGSAIMDANKRVAATRQREELERARTAAAEDPARRAAAEAALAEFDARQPQPFSAGFWSDLLSDENGVTLHRFQSLAWTLVLVLVFVVSVYNRLAMPEFDGTLLALMGLSSGAFLGFKIPEAPAPNAR